MKRRLEKGYDTVLMFIGLLLLFYLGLNLVRTQILIQNAMEPKYLYQKDYSVDGKRMEEMMDQAAQIFEGKGDNCVIRGVNASIGYTNNYQEILLYLSAEAFEKRERFDLEGWDKTPNSVLIEGRLKGRCYWKDGERWVVISGMEFPVYGIVEENEILAQSVHMKWNNLDEEHRKKYLERQDFCMSYYDGIPVQIQSLTKLGDEIEDFQALLGNYAKEQKTYKDYTYNARQQTYKKMNILYCIMEIFGLFSIYYLTELWFARRKREFLIRRMLGSSMFSIWGAALREAGGATGLAFGCAMLISMLQMSLHMYGTLGMQDIFMMLASALLITVFLEVLLFGMQLWKIMRISPTQQNIESMD